MSVAGEDMAEYIAVYFEYAVFIFSLEEEFVRIWLNMGNK
jgi:hypothetical protein